MGCALSRPPPPAPSLWHDTVGDDTVPAGPARPGVVRRRDRRRRLHRPLDGVLPEPSPTRRCGSPCSRRRWPGFGASGRNGGWCSALFPTPWRRLVRELVARPTPAPAPGDGRHGRRGRPGGRRRGHRRPLPARRHHDPGPYRRATRAAPRRDRAPPATAASPRTTCGCSTPRRPARCSPRTDVTGGLFTPHCAAVHPARLVRGLARAVEARGVPRVRGHPGHEIATRVRADLVRPGAAEVVVRATEGYTAGAAGTPPRDRPGLLADGRDRAAAAADLGARSGCRPDDLHRRAARDHLRPAHRRRSARVRRSRGAVPLRLADPPGAGPGAAGVRRAAADAARAAPAAAGRPARSPTPGADRSASPGTGRPRSASTAPPAWPGPAGTSATASATTNLAGRTLADLVLGRDTDLVTLPWVGHRSRRWEPEPLRWLGINAGLQAMRLADCEERRTSRPSVVARAMAPLMHG